MSTKLDQDRLETAPMLAPWGLLGPLVAEIIITHPDLARRLTLASPSMFHSMAAFLHFSHFQGSDAEAIAQDLHAEDVRTLLATAVSNPHPRLYNLFSRLSVRPKRI